MDNIFYHNIYVPINDMPEAHSKFYNEYYNYRLFCSKEQKKVKNTAFKLQPKFKEIILKLNNYYANIQDLKDVSPNSVGEYPYPRIGYKKKDNNIFACINGTNMRRELDFSQILFYVALHYNSNLIIRATSTGNHIILESNVETLLCNMQDKALIYQNKKMLPMLEEIIKPFKSYPKNSLVELDLGNVFLKNDIEKFIKDF